MPAHVAKETRKNRARGKAAVKFPKSKSRTRVRKTRKGK